MYHTDVCMDRWTCENIGTHVLNYRPRKETDQYTKTDRDGNSTDRWTCEQRDRKYTHTHTHTHTHTLKICRQKETDTHTKTFMDLDRQMNEHKINK